MDNVLMAAATAIVQQGPFAALAYFLLRYILNTFAERMEGIADQMGDQVKEITQLHSAIDALPDAIKAALYECLQNRRKE